LIYAALQRTGGSSVRAPIPGGTWYRHSSFLKECKMSYTRKARNKPNKFSEDYRFV